MLQAMIAAHDTLSSPAWLNKLLVAAVIGSLGYVADKLLITLRRWRERKRKRRADLLRLQGLLTTMQAIFLVQGRHRDKLFAAIEERNGVQKIGYEATFVANFATFNASDKQSHALIRGITIHSLKPLNDQAIAWVNADVFYRSNTGSTLDRSLAEHLNQLATHLMLWRALYEMWIPSEPSHALVYLADELDAGIGFPTGVEGLIDRVLSKSQKITAGSTKPSC
jgi:hypothetical protein